MNKDLTATQRQAQSILAKARELGVILTIGERVLTAYVGFPPGDANAYLQAEQNCYEVLRLARMSRAGNTWGTDSGSVGGQVGLRGGYCRISKSGVNRNVLRALRNLL